jgi:hypothetical protein
MDMEQLFIYLAIAIGAFHLGKLWTMKIFAQSLSENPDNMIKLLEHIRDINKHIIDDDMPEDAIPMDIEQVGDVFYAYNKITGEFLAQAQTIYQVSVLATARFPDKKFWHPSLKQSSQTA